MLIAFQVLLTLLVILFLYRRYSTPPSLERYNSSVV